MTLSPEHYLPGTGTSGDTVRAMPRAGRILSRPWRTLFARNRYLWGCPTGHCQGNECQGWGGLCPGLGGHYLPTDRNLGLSNWTLWGRQCPGLAGHCPGLGGHYLPGTGTSGAIQLDTVRAMPRAGRTLFGMEDTICPNLLGLSNWTLSGQPPGLAGHCPGLAGYHLQNRTSGAIQLTLSGQCPGLGGQYLPGTGTLGLSNWMPVRQWPGWEDTVFGLARDMTGQGRLSGPGGHRPGLGGHDLAWPGPTGQVWTARPGRTPSGLRPRFGLARDRPAKCGPSVRAWEDTVRAWEGHGLPWPRTDRPSVDCQGSPRGRRLLAPSMAGKTPGCVL